MDHDRHIDRLITDIGRIRSEVKRQKVGTLADQRALDDAISALGRLQGRLK